MSTATFDILARDRASSVLSKVAKNVDKAGSRLQKIGKGAERAGTAMTLGLTAPIVALGAKSFQVFATFDQTMRQVGVQTGQTGKGMKQMSDLALKMGKDTSFSAGQAADAMLELAKGGMTAAQIKGGVLKQTLTLAAAGGLELGAAAGYMANTLNMFGLEAKDAAKVAAALAGGANASTASVESLGTALSQVGPGARNAGLSLNDTVAVLAAFDQAGIKGSDAGTSLKTMLSRLVPQTAKAKDAMHALGIKFTDSSGKFKHISEIALILQQRMKGLSEAERTKAMATIFGSDATRAATVLMNEGAAGVNKYLTATRDLTAAQKMAKTNTEGAAGAIEQMQGSIETAQIVLGKALAPIVTKAAKKVMELANSFTNLSPEAQETALKIALIVAALGPALIVFGKMVQSILVLRTAWMALNVAMSFSVFGLIVIALAAVAVGLVVLYKKSETFRSIVQKAFAGVASAALSLTSGVLKFTEIFLMGLKLITKGVLNWARTFLDSATKALSWVPELGPKLKRARSEFDKFSKGVGNSFDKGIDKVRSWDRSVKGMQKKIVLRAEISELNRKINKAKARLKEKGLTRPKATQIRAEIGQLYRQVARAKQALNGIMSRTVFVNVQAKVDNQLRGRYGFAKGTPSAPPGFAMVGEEGPELVRLKGGERIWPADETKQIMQGLKGSGFSGGGGRGGGATVVHNHYSFAGAFPNYVGSRDELVKAVRSAVRDRGGNVQVALGKR